MGQKQPHHSAIAAMWAGPPLLRPAPMPAQPLAWVAAMGQLRSNIRQCGACFSVAQHPVLDWFWQRNRLPATGFVAALLASHALAQALPDLVAELDASDAGWQPLPGRSLPEHLARCLLWGGAYAQFAGSQAEALALAGQSCAQLGLPPDWDGVQAWRSNRAWSNWFDGVAWDTSTLIADRQQRRAWLLTVTDTD